MPPRDYSARHGADASAGQPLVEYRRLEVDDTRHGDFPLADEARTALLVGSA